MGLIETDRTPDIRVGRLFGFVHDKAIHAGVFVEDLDSDLIWAMFRRTSRTALGVEEEEIGKDKGIIQDLGAA